ncbi:37S ribosomal protein NAM9, mitochondrial [Colletotrichum chlorophyti]|uniref:37S ribosomal protein NAM9, mitochondrial n=1 Tax=Colletotrichum chlorophyti TaxID=708187 RepID=A0A1Q8S2W3_9PEZI|nr:37S ribosomal protein NAM9, mitochondrial [Colletotrichum chlorophyti]
MRGRKPRWYNLSKPKVRQAWNKHNLFNLVRAQLKQFRHNKTFFQQKWSAKSMTRAYHGAHIKETDWNRAFSRRLLSAVDMPPQYLASYDGSEQAAGRGSGRTVDPLEKNPGPSASNYSLHERQRQAALRSEDDGSARSRFIHPRMAFTHDPLTKLLRAPVTNMTPYMQMAYAPLERRLDVAIFRAMFASSTLQAKQFCTHGAVKVNGKKMRYGSYKLNPGDMFQVDVDSVLYATGRAKTPEHAKFLRGEDWASKQAAKAESKQGSVTTLDPEASEQASGDTAVEAEAVSAAEEAAEDPEIQTLAEGENAEESQLTEEERTAQHHKQLKALVQSAKSLISDGEGLNPRKKRQLRSFMTEAKRALSRTGRTADVDTAKLDHNGVVDNLAALLKDFKLEGSSVEAVASPESEQQQQQPSAKEKATTEATTELISSAEVRKQILGLSEKEQEALLQLLRKDAENPIDESKPYWTPWQPRRYMAPFAFIPRYLEVNQNICAAVYLRHPVARRGMAEVPTPFTYETNQLAFNWYLRRG